MQIFTQHTDQRCTNKGMWLKFGAWWPLIWPAIRGKNSLEAYFYFKFIFLTLLIFTIQYREYKLIWLNKMNIIQLDMMQYLLLLYNNPPYNIFFFTFHRKMFGDLWYQCCVIQSQCVFVFQWPLRSISHLASRTMTTRPCCLRGNQ